MNLFSHLCSVLPAWCRDGCRLRTGHKGNPQGRGPSRRAVSMGTSGRGDSSCSGSSSPCGVPCPCLWVGTSPCSAASSGDLHPWTHIISIQAVSLWRSSLSRYILRFPGLLYISTCLKRFRWRMRMSGRVHRLSLMLPCWSCLQCGHRHASSGAS